MILLIVSQRGNIPMTNDKLSSHILSLFMCLPKEQEHRYPPRRLWHFPGLGHGFWLTHSSISTQIYGKYLVYHNYYSSKFNL